MALDAFRRQAESHVRFFDHLVELVPAKHYVEREEPPANLKYLKKVWRLSPSSPCWSNSAHSGLIGAVHARMLEPQRSGACGRLASSASARGWTRTQRRPLPWTCSGSRLRRRLPSRGPRPGCSWAARRPPSTSCGSACTGASRCPS